MPTTSHARAGTLDTEPSVWTADTVVRGQVEAIREVSTSSRESRDESGLRRPVDSQAAKGLRYAAIVLDHGTLERNPRISGFPRGLDHDLMTP